MKYGKCKRLQKIGCKNYTIFSLKLKKKRNFEFPIMDVFYFHKGKNGTFKKNAYCSHDYVAA